MRKHVVAAALTFAFALTGLAGGTRDARAVTDEQANCAGELSSTTATTDGLLVGELNSALAAGASTNCGEGGPEPPAKK